MNPKKHTPRADYRLEQSVRVNASPSLSEKFHELKALTVEFGYYTAEGITRNSQIKYTVNPDFARSVFRLDCMNHECVGGDFDLSEAVAQAVAARRATVSAELCCQGWLNKHTIHQIHCHNILRYKLTLEYRRHEPAATSRLQPV